MSDEYSPPPPLVALLRPPFPPGDFIPDIIGDLFGSSNSINDANLKTSAMINAVLFVVIMLLFCILQSNSILYKIRLVSPSVTVKPPRLHRGVNALWAWFSATLTTTDEELLSSAGLDALMMVKMCTAGVQMFFPMMVLGLVVLIPIHMSGTYIDDSSQGNPSSFMKATLTNVSKGDNVLWVHFVLIWLYLAYACWILKWHYHQFVIIRRIYMKKGDNVNIWRQMHDPPASTTRTVWSNVGHIPAMAKVVMAMKQAGGQVAKTGDRIGEVVDPIKNFPRTTSIGVSLMRKMGVSKNQEHHAYSTNGLGVVDESVPHAANVFNNHDSSVIWSDATASEVDIADLAALQEDQDLLLNRADRKRVKAERAAVMHNSEIGTSNGAGRTSRDLDDPTMRKSPGRVDSGQIGSGHVGSPGKGPTATSPSQAGELQRTSLNSLQSVPEHKPGIMGLEAQEMARETTSASAGRGVRYMDPDGDIEHGSEESFSNWNADDALDQLPQWWKAGITVSPIPIRKNPAPPLQHTQSDVSTADATGSVSESGIGMRRRALSARQPSIALPPTEVGLNGKTVDVVKGGVDMGLLAQPSVRYRKTINAVTKTGETVAVNAQLYTVLVTDVNQNPLVADTPMWSHDERIEGQGLISYVIPTSWRKWVFHNYAGGLVKQDKDGNEEVYFVSSSDDEDEQEEAESKISSARFGKPSTMSSTNSTRYGQAYSRRSLPLNPSSVDSPAQGLGSSSSLPTLTPTKSQQSKAGLKKNLSPSTSAQETLPGYKKNLSPSTSARETQPGLKKNLSPGSSARETQPGHHKNLSIVPEEVLSVDIEDIEPILVSEGVAPYIQMTTVSTTSLTVEPSAQTSATSSTLLSVEPSAQTSASSTPPLSVEPSSQTSATFTTPLTVEPSTQASAASSHPSSVKPLSVTFAASPSLPPPQAPSPPAPPPLPPSSPFDQRSGQQNSTPQSEGVAGKGAAAAGSAASAAAGSAAVGSAGSAAAGSAGSIPPTPPGADTDVIADPSDVELNFLPWEITEGHAAGLGVGPPVDQVTGAPAGAAAPTAFSASAATLATSAGAPAADAGTAPAAGAAPSPATAEVATESAASPESMAAVTDMTAPEPAATSATPEAADATVSLATAAEADITPSNGATDNATTNATANAITNATANATTSAATNATSNATTSATTNATTSATANPMFAPGPEAADARLAPPSSPETADARLAYPSSPGAAAARLTPPIGDSLSAAAPKDGGSAVKGAAVPGCAELAVLLRPLATSNGDDAAAADDDEPIVAVEGGAVISGLDSETADSKKKECKGWEKVRQAVRLGRVRRLPWRKEYSVVTATFKRIFPKEFIRAIPVIKHQEVDRVLLKLDLINWQWQRASIAYKTTGKKPMSRTGCFGLWGERYDVLDTLREKLILLNQEVVEARARAVKEGATPSWFVFFKTQQAAAMASQSLIHGEDNHEFKVHVAPGPEEVNWSALWMSYKQKDFRGWFLKPLLVIIILIPIGIFSGALMQLDFLLCPTRTCTKPINNDRVQTTNPKCPVGFIENGDTTDKQSWAWYCAQDDVIAQVFARLITGWLPALLLVLWQGVVLPLVLYLLVQATGRSVSLSHLDIQIGAWLVAFQVFNYFLGGVVGSSIAQQINQLVGGGPSEIFQIIGNYLPSSSNFFVNVLMFRTLVAVPLRLVIPHPGVRFYVFRRWLRCTSVPLAERDKAFLYTLTSPRYGADLGNMSGIFLIGLAFSVISPVVPCITVLLFIMMWIFWRHSLLYVYIRKYESGGLMWPFMFVRIIWFMVITVFFTACVFIVKEAYIQAFLLLGLAPIALYRFHDYCRLRFEQGTETLPLLYAKKAPEANVHPSVYIPPPLNQKALGWHPEWTKPWTGWGIPAYSF